ncbi:hypothetical protein V1506DRAFT_561543 [Lipomyces tetrasporus]
MLMRISGIIEFMKEQALIEEPNPGDRTETEYSPEPCLVRSTFGPAESVSFESDKIRSHVKPAADEFATRPRKPATGCHTAALEGDCGYNMVDDDESIVLDCRVLFCPVCETAIDKSAGCDGKWVVADGVGEASTVTIERETAQILMYCLNCSVLNVVIQRDDQYGFVAEGDELVHHDELQGHPDPIESRSTIMAVASSFIYQLGLGASVNCVP